MSLLADDIDRIFSPTGVFAGIDGFEYRPQQHTMARAIATTLEDRAHLMIEAPTGIGKTLAYLVPSLLFATRNHRRAIISTHTKNLQDQIFHKDLPIARKLLESDFCAEVLKGRRNYLCSTRLRTALSAPSSLFTDEASEQLSAIHRWAETDSVCDVDIAPFAPSPEVWDMVCSERGICAPSSCGTACPYQRVRERIRAADVVIMNHALFFSLMAIQENEERFIFDDDFVVFDESHTLPGVAATGIGARLSRHQMLTALHRLYHPRTGRGLLARQGRRVKALCEDVENSVDSFFETVSRAARSHAAGTGPQSTAIRIRTPGLVVNSLAGPLGTMHRELEKLGQSGKNALLRPELDAVRQTLAEMEYQVDTFLEQADPSFTYWIELSRSRDPNITLCSSPSEIGDMIGPRLFKEGTSVVMTSATLAVNNSLDYAKERIGAHDIRTMILDSPFDHMRQMRLCLSADIAEPDSEGYDDELPSWVLRSIERSGGKALVLFTSAALIKSTAAFLAEPIAELGFTLFVQGTDLPRHEMLEAFREDIHSVLFGLDSFWMGVDVPGEALEHVIITRLPFAVPNHPLIEARLEAIARRGGQAFLEFTLPEAVLKFRQGVGRLIRTRSDRGMVTVLDSRILRKSYGRIFLGSIPRSPVEILRASGEAEDLPLEEW